MQKHRGAIGQGLLIDHWLMPDVYHVARDRAVHDVPPHCEHLTVFVSKLDRQSNSQDLWMGVSRDLLFTS